MHIQEYIGHIRNWRDLCAKLGIDDRLSRHERERAIILAGYERWGVDLGSHIYGMFAIVLTNEQTGEIFCLRDQFGTKPMYYYETSDGELLCGTSIRAIMSQSGFCKQLNESMLQLFLTYTYVPGEETFFKGLYKLMPGFYIHRKKGEKVKPVRYWRPVFSPETGRTVEEWADRIHETMREIMDQVKDPDEEAASFLSGGVDSSYVLALSDAKFAASCGYDEERFDESALAGKTAAQLGVEHVVRKIQPKEYFDAIEYVMENMEQPLADASAIVFALGARAAAERTKLCYSGEGADEFFGGYNMYRNAKRYEPNLTQFYIGNTNIMKEDEKKELLLRYDPDVLPIHLTRDIYENARGLDPLSKMSLVDIVLWLEGDIYLNVDKMSRAAGLEVRMPMTDLRMFDIAAHMPAECKIDEEQNKLALRLAASKILPEEVAYRKKLGFIVPIRIWMADPAYNGLVKEMLFGDMAARFFHVDKLRDMFAAYEAGDSDLWRKLYTIYTFLVWYKLYFSETLSENEQTDK